MAPTNDNLKTTVKNREEVKMENVRKNDMILAGKRILVTGGTGSLGKVLIRRLLAAELGIPKQIVVFSRDEAKQHYMRLDYQNRRVAIDDFVYRNFEALVSFRIGDVRDFHSISSALQDTDIVINTAALKQVPACEYFPYEAVRTNITGPENIVRSIRQLHLPVETVIGISTDKACMPINVMGMTKAIQERVFLRGNLECPDTRFICVRYGNVLASRGSIIPLFHEQIRNGGPVTITTADMTRFLLSLNQAVDTVFAALKRARKGEIFVPRVPSVRVVDLAKELIGNRKVEMKIIGIRPGEKIHEVLVSEEEAFRTMVQGEEFYVILPILPELREEMNQDERLEAEFNSADHLMSQEDIDRMLDTYRIRVEHQLDLEKELLV
jgi:FlaA1/EpsC-like NDP-sugar epimerase